MGQGFQSIVLWGWYTAERRIFTDSTWASWAIDGPTDVFASLMGLGQSDCTHGIQVSSLDIVNIGFIEAALGQEKSALGMALWV